MPRGVLLSPNEAQLSDDELAFYFPKLVSTYVDLEKRRRRRLALGTTFLFSAATIAFAASTDTPTTLPLIGVKLNSVVATAALYAMGVFCMVLSTFDRVAAQAFLQEVELLHTLRYKTESPTWYLRTPTVLDTIQLLQPRLKQAMQLYRLFIGCLATLIFAILANYVWTWKDTPLTAHILFGVGTAIFVSTAWLARFLPSASSDLLNELRSRTAESEAANNTLDTKT